MPEAAITEFWKELKPIQKVFQLDALPEVYSHDAPGGDDRLFVPFTETVSSKPLWISPGQNKWCDILMAKSAGLVNRHYHPHEVFAYTIPASGATESTIGPRPPAILSTKPPVKRTPWWRTSAKIR